MSKKIVTTLCFLGCFLGILCLFIGICIANSAKQSVCERFNGEPEHINAVFISSEKQSTFKEENYEKAISKLDANSVITIGPAIFNYRNKENKIEILNVFPTYFKEKPAYLPHMIYGRYLTKEEVKNGDSVIVLSSRLFNDMNGKAFTSNSYVEINKVKLKVVGVFDGTVKNSPILNSAFIPIKNSDKIIGTKGITGFASFQIYSRKNNLISEAEKIKRHFQAIDSDANLSIHNPSEDFGVDISVSCYIISLFSLAIFIITAINISNLSTMWLIDKQRDFAIMKALGATDIIIVKSILLNICSTYMVSSLFAIVLGYLIVPFIQNAVSISFISSYNNVLICFLVAVAAALLSSIVPVVKAKKMNIANSLKWE